MATHGASILPKSQWKSPKSLEFSIVLKQKKNINYDCYGAILDWVV